MRYIRDRCRFRAGTGLSSLRESSQKSTHTLSAVYIGKIKFPVSHLEDSGG